MSVTHLSYERNRHRSAEECLAAIKQRLESGWQVADIVAGRGRYEVIYRRLQEMSPADGVVVRAEGWGDERH